MAGQRLGAVPVLPIAPLLERSKYQGASHLVPTAPKSRRAYGRPASTNEPSRRCHVRVRRSIAELSSAEHLYDAQRRRL